MPFSASAQVLATTDATVRRHDREGIAPQEARDGNCQDPRRSTGWRAALRPRRWSLPWQTFDIGVKRRRMPSIWHLGAEACGINLEAIRTLTEETGYQLAATART